MTSRPSPKIWCDKDDHRHFENFGDFNEWLDGEEAEEVRKAHNVDGLTQPSKGFFAGDREAYEQVLAQYRLDQRHYQLNKTHIDELSSDNHWSDRNTQHFEQLISRIGTSDVVPFIGAGISQPSGFPTWKEHLRQQGRTAGIAAGEIDEKLSQGLYEEIVHQIEELRGSDVFIQEIRDVFGQTRSITEAIFLIAEIFSDTLITTNYDRLIEQAFDTGGDKKTQIITPVDIVSAPDAEQTTVIKLHGDIGTPAECILSKGQYDDAYGVGAVDVSLQIPEVLDYYFRNSSLLFLGCSLQQDRTVDVFKAIKKSGHAANIPQHFVIEQCPQSEGGMVDRNAYLAQLGITPIWFEKGQFEFVEGILRMARNELQYRHVDEKAAE